MPSKILMSFPWNNQGHLRGDDDALQTHIKNTSEEQGKNSNEKRNWLLTLNFLLFKHLDNPKHEEAVQNSSKTDKWVAVRNADV